MRSVAAIAILALAGCHHVSQPRLQPTAFGVSIADPSPEIRIAGVGATLDQPLTAQVNDADGNGISGALVEFAATSGVSLYPRSGLTGSDGQFSTKVRLGGTSGRYSIVATTPDRSGKPLNVTFAAIALDYQQTLGRELSEKHCARCHDSRSTAERVSNFDNLSAPPHAFSDGSVLNRMSTASLIAIIAHGGAALGQSPEMPPYSPTLSSSEIDALVAWIRAVAI